MVIELWCSSQHSKSLERVGLCLPWGHLDTCPPCTPPPRMPLPTCTRRNLASTMLFPRPISEQGYATEAPQALINYAFTQLHLKRIVATTTYEHEASIGVMRKVGMRIEKNPSPDPSGFQVVGILENRLTHGLPTGT